jgi:hypothetical protein
MVYFVFFLKKIKGLSYMKYKLPASLARTKCTSKLTENFYAYT